MWGIKRADAQGYLLPLRRDSETAQLKNSRVRFTKALANVDGDAALSLVTGLADDSFRMRYLADTVY